MRFGISELARALDAELLGCDDPAVTIEGLAIDSRSIVPGQLFAAVSDVRDGHDFVAAARRAGAAAALVDHRVDDGPCLVVGDVQSALAALGGLARGALTGPVVGVTGSVGKTTTKDLLAAVLATTMPTTASERSFNNELGVPMTLVNAPGDTRATVIEMGARGRGHIEHLCSMARPTVGVVTAVQAVHTQVMGDEDEIARTKSELVRSLPDDGLAVLNADDHRVAAMAGLTDAQVISFGTADSANVRAFDVRLADDLRARFTIDSDWGPIEVHLGARGLHNVGNATAAAAVGLWAGVPPDAVAEGLAGPLASPWRMELRRNASGSVVLNDAYNAGPASMAAALRSLAALPAKRRVAVLGVMAELGERSTAEHLRVADLADELGVEILAVDTDLYGIAGVPAAQVVSLMGDSGMLGAGSAVLVKGSRVAGLEVLVEELEQREGGPVSG